MRYLWIILGLSLSFIGCATSRPILVQPVQNTGATAPVFAGKTIFIMPPKVTYRDVRNEQELSRMEKQSQKVYSQLVSFSEKKISSRQGFKVLTSDNLNENQKESSGFSLSNLAAQSEIILKLKNKSREKFITQLQSLGSSVSANAVLVQVLEVKVGMATQWSPITGVMAAGTNSFDLKSGLIEVTTGNIVWQQEIETSGAAF